MCLPSVNVCMWSDHNHLLEVYVPFPPFLSRVCVCVPTQVGGPQDFEWVKNVRYYWDTKLDDCVVRMSNSHYIYGYEYLGASARLVITPLTVSWRSEV